MRHPQASSPSSPSRCALPPKQLPQDLTPVHSKHQSCVLHETFPPIPRLPGPSVSLSAQSTFCSKIPIKFCCPRSPGCNSKHLQTLSTLYAYPRRPLGHTCVSPGPGFSPPLPHTRDAPLSPGHSSAPRAGRPPLGSVPSSVPRQPWVASQRSPAAPARRSCSSPSFILRRRCH